MKESPNESRVVTCHPDYSLPKQRGKWLEGIGPDDPLSRAASAAARLRLEYVAACLPLAAYSADGDPEFVHQLRVGSRRASAALAAFDECFPDRKCHKMRRRLRRIRKAAGAARDQDVLLMRFKSPLVSLTDGELQLLTSWLVDRRRAVQPSIVSQAKKTSAKEFTIRIRRLVDRVKWRGHGNEPTVFRFGKTYMRQVIDEFDQAAQKLTQQREIEELHALRIAGKHLRYTIELFACVAKETLRQSTYPLVEELQERLGTINDHAAAECFLRRSAQQTDHPAMKGNFNRLANAELQSVASTTEDFFAWWNRDRQTLIHAGAQAAFAQNPAA